MNKLAKRFTFRPSRASQTPFRRADGRWLTDVTTLHPLLHGAECRFNLLAGGTPWVANLSLLLRGADCPIGCSGSSEVTTAASASEVVVQRYQGTAKSATPDVVAQRLLIPLVFPNMQTTFDCNYNLNRTISFDIPLECSSVRLRALITGHGSDPPPPFGSGCEYAPSAFNFSLNGKLFSTSAISPAQYLLAGSAYGCAEKVASGVIPNQHGDWYNGRNGWCPGSSVIPFEIDVSSAVIFGEKNVLTYSAVAFLPNGTVAICGCGGYVLFSGFVAIS